jgi:excinuclease ABC subunit A
MVDRVMALPEGTRLYLLAPVVRGRKGEYRKELAEWQKAGFTRVRIDGEMLEIQDAPALDKKFKHDIEVVVDRLAVREGDRDPPRRQLRAGAQARRGAGLRRPRDDVAKRWPPPLGGAGRGRGPPTA